MPIYWKPWLMSLLISNMIVPLFFLSAHVEAWVVLGTALATGAIFIVLTAYSGFSRLLGLGHLPWIPMIVYLILQIDQAPHGTWFVFWLKAVVVLDICSLFLDGANVVRYLMGEHEEMVDGLSGKKFLSSEQPSQ
jgi:hypothetical protein